MRYLTKIFIYLFVSSTMAIFGYHAVKFARDQVRITNAQTMARVIQYYQLTEHRLPPSGEGENVSQFLLDRKLTNKPLRDPIFTSATVILDKYVLSLIKIYDKLMKSNDIAESAELIEKVKNEVNGLFEETDDSNEQIARLKAISNDNDIMRNLSDFKEVVNLSDRDLNKLRSILKDSDLKENIDQLRQLASQPTPPECVIAYHADRKKGLYEISVKLESIFLQSRMKEDGGNDDERYEIGNELKLNTSIKVYGGSVRAASKNTSIIQ